MTGRSIRLTLPEPLARRIDAFRGEDEVQDVILATLRDKVYGSLVEAQLRAEVNRFHQTLRAFGGAGAVQAQPRDNLLDTLLGGEAAQPVAPRDEPQAQPKKLGW